MAQNSPESNGNHQLHLSDADYALIVTAIEEYQIHEGEWDGVIDPAEIGLTLLDSLNYTGEKLLPIARQTIFGDEAHEIPSMMKLAGEVISAQRQETQAVAWASLYLSLTYLATLQIYPKNRDNQ